MKFPMQLNAGARMALSAVQTLRKFFSRLGKASETRIKVILDNFKKADPTVVFPPSILEETDEYYAVKNFVEKLPPNLSPPQYFNLAIELLQKLGRGEEALDRHGLYTFKYIAVTKGKYYDVFPVILLTSADRSYYRGFNFHWERAPQYVESVYRNYNFSRVQSKFYRIKPHELEYFLQIPTFLPIYIPE
jgi:hypothetical protein